MNYSSIRASDNYTAVSVNHRALITRTLTKYPVDYALFRELLQNSADAKAKCARIIFEPHAPIDASQPASLHNAVISKLIFQNDGLVFSDSDWNRLKEIAKGNPDENKIGAFGVGFYSVFELTDTPLVHSGNWVMSFHFVGDELRYSKSQSDQYVDGTLIDIPYRSKDATLPDLVKFISFLTQSFMLLSLNQVSLYLGQDLKLFEITKLQSPPTQIVIPRNLNPYSFNKVFRLEPPQISRVQVEVTYLNATQMRKQDLSSATGIFRFGKSIVSSFFTSSENPLEETKLISFLQRVDGTAQVSVSSSFRNKMIETVLKPPAKKTSMSLLTYNKQDMDQSTLKSPLSNCIFPNDFNDAKLVIGFPTKQSTGIKTHLALNQLIPTMERTAVDMSNATVKDWNSELLYVAGILARCVYEHELSIAASQNSLDTQLSYATYTMKRFQMSNSAPDASVGQRFAAGFWRCLNVVAVPTQLGIQPSTKARLAGTTPRALIRHTPVLTAADEDNNVFVDQIKQIGYVKELSMADLAGDLQTTPISPALFDELVKWAPESAQLSAIVNAVVISDADEKGGIQGLILGRVKYYQNVFTIPDGMPIPDTCLPHQLASKHRIPDLKKFGWRELTHTIWVEYLTQLSKKPGPFNMVLNKEFAVNVLNVLSNGWVRQTTTSSQRLCDLLSNLNCIPTQNGMKTPSESYLKQIALFPDLPVIDSSVSASKQFLLGINVRESVGMDFVLKVLHDPASSLTWSSQDLVSYLCDNRSKLLKSDWGILQKGLFFQDTQSDSLVSVSTLYAPDTTLAELGFHTLEWKAGWQSTSPEAQLLFKLGLKRAPSSTTLFEQAIKQSAIKQALQYYLAKYDENHYNGSELASTNYKIIPTVNGDFVAPKHCYYDMEASHFGLHVISRRFQEFQAQRLAVEVKPKVQTLLEYIFAHPQSDSDSMFSYLGTRLSSFTAADVTSCKDRKFIPVRNGFETPQNVFFSGSDPHLASLFHVIKPSDQAMQFLRKVGVQELPSITQIAWRTIQDPKRVYEAFGNGSAYKQLLVRFETEWQSLKRDKALVSAMKTSPFLIGENYDQQNDATTHGLFAASEISIVDNIIILNQFKHLITACPQDSLLEDFYHRLGSLTLSSSLMERANVGRVVENPEGPELKQVICDRLVLFLESTSKETRIKSQQVQSMEIVFVSSIQLDRKLKNTPVVSHTTSAYMSPNETNKLYLTIKPDWFQVSGVLTRHALKRPDPESVIVLELQLSSSLESLQRKGYNVNRLLKRQREIEDAKYLEQVRQENLRKQQLEEQRQKAEIEERERQVLRAAEAAAASSALEAQNQVGSSTESAVNHPTKPEIASNVKGTVQKTADPEQVPSLANAELPGLKAVQNMMPSANGLLGSFFKSKNKANSRENPHQQRQIQAPQPAATGTGQPGSSQSNAKTLKNGISTSRPFSRDNLNSVENQNTPDAPMPVSCRPQRVYDYRVGAKMSDGLKIFVKKHNASPPTDDQVDLAYELRPILQTCAEIYNVRWDAISMYIGELESIAFNTGGSLFFNLDVFINRKVSGGWNSSKQLDFWFTVMAHELAHNLVASHGEQHSFYTESYIQEYMSELHARQS